MPQQLIVNQLYNATTANLFVHLDLLTTVEVNIVLPAVSRLVLVWEKTSIYVWKKLLPKKDQTWLGKNYQ